MRNLAFALMLTAFAGLVSAPARAADDWVIRESARGVEETVDRLREAIERSGSQVLAVFDHQSAAAAVGHDLPPSTVILFAKPRTVSRLIAENPRAAIDMPQRLLVWQEDGVTHTGFVSPTALATRYGIDQNHPELGRLRAALVSLVDAAHSRQDERTGARAEAAR